MPFFSIPVNKVHQKQFAFSCQDQQYTFAMLPQGYINSLSLYHHLVNNLERILITFPFRKMQSSLPTKPYNPADSMVLEVPVADSDAVWKLWQALQVNFNKGLCDLGTKTSQPLWITMESRTNKMVLAQTR